MTNQWSMKACIAKQQLPFPPTAPAEKLGAAPTYKQHHELTSSYTDPKSADRGRLSPARCAVWAAAVSAWRCVPWGKPCCFEWGIWICIQKVFHAVQTSSRKWKWLCTRSKRLDHIISLRKLTDRHLSIKIYLHEWNKHELSDTSQHVYDVNIQGKTKMTSNHGIKLKCISR